MIRAGWASAIFWVLGMGSRFAFSIWVFNGGSGSVERFSRAHSITSSQAYVAALLAMAVAEVVGRTAIIALRNRRLVQGAVIATA